MIFLPKLAQEEEAFKVKKPKAILERKLREYFIVKFGFSCRPRECVPHLKAKNSIIFK